MDDKNLSTQRRRIEPWDEILLRVIQIQGPDIFRDIVKNKVSGRSAPQPAFTPTDIVEKLQGLASEWKTGGARPLAVQAAHQSRAWVARLSRRAPSIWTSRAADLTQRWRRLKQGVRQVRFGPNRKEPLEQAALETLTMMGFWGGTLFGLQLPQLDLKLSAKGQEKDSLILHAAALMATEVASEWIQEVLRRTLLAPGLGDGESRYLRGVSRVLDASTRGVQRGWNARQVVGLWIRFWRSPLAKQHRVATDARAIRIAQEVIERLRKT